MNECMHILTIEVNCYVCVECGIFRGLVFNTRRNMLLIQIYFIMYEVIGLKCNECVHVMDNV